MFMLFKFVIIADSYQLFAKYSIKATLGKWGDRQHPGIGVISHDLGRDAPLIDDMDVFVLACC